ncbi:type II secretion system protein J [Pseudoxanthomonas mexicana]|uniref:PulJ/GspJ family protein n=1 Tax=Pseudoxanthomonas mexicana TaxID=128785 RepID=UPI00398A9145
MKGRRDQCGFSLLEAIVALTILATAGLALFAAMNQSVQMASRAENARLADSALRNAMAWLETVNPAETPQGEQQLGEARLRWHAELVEPARDAMTGYMQAGLFQVGLYDVTLEVSQSGRPLAEVVVRRVGYRQVREPERL